MKIKPYFETKLGKLYCGDCLDIMQTMDDNSVDLVLTDPPYGVRKTEEWDERENFLVSIDLWLKESFNVGKIVIWFCSGKMLPYILQDKKNFRRLLTWNKPKMNKL